VLVCRFGSYCVGLIFLVYTIVFEFRWSPYTEFVLNWGVGLALSIFDDLNPSSSDCDSWIVLNDLELSGLFSYGRFHEFNFEGSC
jgi:hypothetical protein